MQTMYVPGFRAARQGEEPTHYWHARLSRVLTVEDHMTSPERGHCVMGLVGQSHEVIVPREEGFGREILAECIALADVVEVCRS